MAGPIQQAAAIVGQEAAQQGSKSIASKLAKGQVKELATSLASEWKLTEAARPDIVTQALGAYIQSVPGLEKALKGVSKNLKKQRQVLEQYGVTKDKVTKYLAQEPRASRQGNILDEPFTSPARVVSREGSTPVPAATPIPDTTRPQFPAPPSVTETGRTSVVSSGITEPWRNKESTAADTSWKPAGNEDASVITPPPPSSKRNNRILAGAGAASLLLPGSAGEEPAQVYTVPDNVDDSVPDDEIVDEDTKKQEPLSAPASGMGGVPTGTTQQVVQTLPKNIEEDRGGQETLANSAQEIVNTRNQFRSAIGGRTTVDRSNLIDAIKSLDTVEEELKKEAAADPSKIPQLKDIVEARRAALDAYKEKANMNEWLSIADRAINAISQFAAGRAALNTPYASTFRPSVTDYGAKTEQAMREFQAESGILEKERAESEQAVTAYERGQEKLADRIRRQREQKVRLLEEDVRKQEREIDKADKLSTDLLDNWMQGRRIEAQEKAATERQTRKETTDTAKLAEADRKQQVSALQNQIKSLNGILKATNSIDLSSKKTIDSGLGRLATSLGTDKESLLEGIVSVGDKDVKVGAREKGWFTDESDKKFLERAVVPSISAEVKSRIEELNQELGRLVGPQTTAPTAEAPPPAASTLKLTTKEHFSQVVEAMRKKAKPGDTDETIKNAARKYLESVGYAAPE